LKEVFMCDHDDGFDGFDWQDLALIGALSESLAEERRECERIRKELEGVEKDEDDDDPLK
jgi:hypothetical protein